MFDGFLNRFCRIGTTPHALKATISILTFFILNSCGDPLVRGSYQGEPLFVVSGVLALVDTLPRGLLSHPKRVSLFWSPSGKTTIPVEQLIEQNAVSIEVEALSDFQLTLFHPPEPNMLLQAEPPYGVAVILIYVDTNNDGQYNAEQGDVLIGGATNNVLVYAPEPISEELSFTGNAIPQGFYLVEVPLFCQNPTALANAPACDAETSSVLGRVCTDNETCGETGSCFVEVGTQGTCALENLLLDCTPTGGRLQEGESGYWLGDCQTTRDCTMYPGHRCDPAYGVCTYFPQNEACPASVVPGAECDVDADCGDAGACLTEDDMLPYTNGYCVYPVTALECTPTNGVPLCNGFCSTASEDPFDCFERCFGDLADDFTFWFQSCQTDNDCRVEDGYRCDPFTRACDAFFDVELLIALDFSTTQDVEPLCDDFE